MKTAKQQHLVIGQDAYLYGHHSKQPLAVRISDERIDANGKVSYIVHDRLNPHREPIACTAEELDHPFGLEFMAEIGDDPTYRDWTAAREREVLEDLRNAPTNGWRM